MPDALEQFAEETIEQLLKKLPAERLLKRVSAEERLKGVPAEERLKDLSVDQLLAALPPEKSKALAQRLKDSGPGAGDE
jgi:hypothetical protein